MKEILTKIYNSEPSRPKKKKKKTEKPSVEISYRSGVTCEIHGEKSHLKYNVKFIDTNTKETVHQDVILVNHWLAPYRKWYTKWRITVTEEIFQKEIFSEEFNLKGEKVLVSFDSNSLGDNIAWVPYIEEFRKKHDCEVSCSTFFNNLFEKEYPKIKFIPVDSSSEDMHASYKIGWFDNWDNREKNPNDLRTIPLQQTASDILGLKYEEIKTKINIESPDRPIKEKYVCISTSSTAGCKHWHGWQEVVDYLNSEGYKVVVIQKEPLDYMDLDSLENVTHPDTKNIQEAITWLYNCDFFIGISSGVSWLAWALNKKVILISGFTDVFHEFSTPYRIINKDVCNSCWQNTDFLFDKGDWNWCPINKDTEKQFECAKLITFDRVRKEIDRARPLKIGLQILAYNCKEAFPRLIEPWAKLKKEYNFKFWVHSRQFRIYEEMGSEDVNAETLEMLKTDYSELIDYLSVPEETLSDHGSRSLCLEFFEKEDVDLIWMLDADEFYTEQQIRNIMDFIKINSQFDWFTIQLKNYVGDGSTWDNFAPPRVIWAKRHGGIKKYHWDNHFSYKDGIEYRKCSNKTIPKNIAFPDHYTWTNTMNTTGPKHIKEKIEYQERFYSDGCGYKWNEEKQSIEINKDNR